MYGHEQIDVIQYCNKTFLPLMADYKRLMVRWIENDCGGFDHIEPHLGPGEWRIFPIFQDESPFHASEYKSNVW